MTTKLKENTRLGIQISIFLCDFDLWKNRKFNGQSFFKCKIQKNTYMKINYIFSATKALIPNDAEPFGGQHRNSTIKND